MEPVTRIAIAVVQRGDSFLVGERPPGVALAGFAEFPGGKIEPGESAEAAAVRECREETGLEVSVTFEYPAQVETYAHGTVELRFFACELTGADQAPSPPYRWVAREALGTLEFPSGNRQLVRRLLDG